MQNNNGLRSTYRIFVLVALDATNGGLNWGSY